MYKHKFLFFSIVFAFLTITSVIVGFFKEFYFSFRLVFGLTYVLYLPGFFWGLILFPGSKIYSFERQIYSIVLSLAIVPFIVFISNIINFKISTSNVFFEILFLIFFGFVIIILKNKYYKKGYK